MSREIARAVRGTLVAAAQQQEMLPRVPTRAQIERLEDEMRRHPPVVIEPVHRFAKGLYAREITIPKGTLITGRVHKAEHINFMHGDITVWTEDGMKRLTGHHTMVSRPGTKRVGYAHADTVWTTVHATEETSLERLEQELVEPERAIVGEQVLIEQEAAA